MAWPGEPEYYRWKVFYNSGQKWAFYIKPSGDPERLLGCHIAFFGWHWSILKNKKL